MLGRLGRFELVAPIGAGGMGSVFRARDRDLARDVAVKILGRRGPGPATGPISEDGPRTEVLSHRRVEDGESPLLAEARAMARLSHPNVVSVYEVGSDGEQVFIAMELVEGEDARAWLSRVRPGHAEILAAFRQAAAGLAAAHAAGLVHRDFKPDNVLVGTDGVVRVADFGLAVSDLDPSRRPAKVAGTRDYIAPEVTAGEPPSRASDVFAFCVSLVEALGGDPGRPAAGVDVRLPRRVRRMLGAGLDPDPAKRPADGAALLAALTPPRRRTAVAIAAGLAALAGAGIALALPTAGSPCDDWQRLDASWNAKWARGIRDRIAGFGGALAADSADRVVLTLERRAARLAVIRRQTCEERAQLLPAVADARDRCLDDALIGFETSVDFLAAVIERGALVDAVKIARDPGDAARCASIDQVRSTEPGESPAARDLRQRLAAIETAAISGAHELARRRDDLAAVVARARELGDRALVARALVVLGRGQAAADQLDAAVTSLREAIQSATATGAERVVVAASIELAGVVGVRQLHFDEADTLVALAGATLERLPHELELRVAYHRMRVQLIGKRGSVDDFPPELERLLAAIDATKDPRHAAERLKFATLSLVLKGRVDEVYRLQLEALATMRSELGDYHPDVIDHEIRMARSLFILRREEDARVVLARAGAAAREAGFHGRARVAARLDALALGKVGRPREAVAAYRAWIATPSPSDDPVDIARAQVELGEVLIDLGELDAARVEFGHAREAVQSKLGPDADELERIHSQLGQLETFAGNRQIGLQHLREALRISEAARSKVAAQIEMDRATIGWWHLEGGQPDAALPLLRRAVDEISKAEWVDATTLSEYKLWLGRCLSDLGRPKEALAVLERVPGQANPTPGARFEMARARFLAGEKAALTDARAAGAAVEARPSRESFQLPRMRAWIAKAGGG